MSEGLITFFKYKKLGFFKYGDDYNEPLEMEDMLSSLHVWFLGRTSLSDTLLWDEDTSGYELRKKVFLKSVKKNDETGDYIIILWRAVGSGNGVYGLRSDSDLNDTKIYNTDDAIDGESVVWGEPAYYWFIPTLNIFASMKFRSSIADTQMVNRYLRDFIELRSNVRPKKKEIKQGKTGEYLSVSFEGKDGDNLWLRIYSEQFTKVTNEADLDKIAQQITHFVKRDVISATASQNQSWTRYFKGLPFISSEVTKDTRKIELTIEAHPTEEELREIFEKYNSEYNYIADNWTNLGFKKEGVGGICWLNEFVIKNTLHVSDIGQDDDSGYYSSDRLFNALHLNRDNLLAAFTVSKSINKIAVNG